MQNFNKTRGITENIIKNLMNETNASRFTCFKALYSKLNENICSLQDYSGDTFVRADYGFSLPKTKVINLFKQMQIYIRQIVEPQVIEDEHLNIMAGFYLYLPLQENIAYYYSKDFIFSKIESDLLKNFYAYFRNNEDDSLYSFCNTQPKPKNAESYIQRICSRRLIKIGINYTGDQKRTLLENKPLIIQHLLYDL